MLNLVVTLVFAYAACSYSVFLLALLSRVTPWSVVAACVVVYALALGMYVRRYRSHTIRAIQPYVPVLIVVLLCFGLLSHILVLPAIRIDDLAYHLYVPQQLLRHGSLYWSPYHINTNFPMLFEYPLTVFQALHLPPFLANYTVLLLLSMAIYVVGSHYYSLDKTFLLWSIPVLVSTPVIYDLTRSAYVELFLALLVFLGLFYYRQFQEDRSKVGHWYICVLFFGLGCATKYTGMIFLALLLGYEFFSKTSTRHYYAGMAVAALVCAPWYVKNWLLLGNPVFPLLNWLFGSAYFSPERDLYYQAVLSSYHAGRALGDFLLLPIRLLLGWTEPGSPDRLGFDGQLSIAYLLVAFGLTFKQRTQRFCSVLFLLFFGIWAAISQQVRFLLPVLFYPAMLGAVRLSRWQTAGRVLFYSLVCVALGQNVYNISSTMAANRLDELLLGQITREAFLVHHLPVSYGFANVVNRLVDRDSRILSIGNFGRFYYFKPQMIINSYYDTEFIDKAFYTEKNDPKIFDEFLKNERISYILIDWIYFNRFHKDNDHINSDGIIKYLRERTKKIAVFKYIELLKIRPW